MKKELISGEINKQNKHWWDKNTFKTLKKFKRDLFFKLIEAYLNQELIISIIGLRRTGKTTILKQIMQYLIEKKKINPKKIMFLSFDEVIITYQLRLEEYLDDFLDSTDDKKLRYIFLDEIQYIDKWQHILKRYYDTRPNIKFFVSGSSSLFIKKKTTESLAGRIFEFKLNPLSFEEFLKISNTENGLMADYNKFSIKNLNEITQSENDYQWFLAAHGQTFEKLFENYLLYHQFPQTIDMTPKEAIYNYIETSVYKKTIEYDIPRLFNIKKIDELKFVYRVLITETSSELEFGRIAGETGIDIHTFKNYINYFHDSLLFDVVYNYSKSIRKSRRLQKKGYIASSNFFTTFHPDLFKIKTISNQYLGKLAETYVYNSLKDKFEYISFYKKQQKEIDFICNNEILSKDETRLIEVKYINDLRREKFDFLEKTAKNIFKTEKYYIISKRNYYNDGKKIIIPCFLLK